MARLLSATDAPVRHFLDSASQLSFGAKATVTLAELSAVFIEHCKALTLTLTHTLTPTLTLTLTPTLTLTLTLTLDRRSASRPTASSSSAAARPCSRS